MDVENFPSSEIRHLITQVVIARAAATRPADPQLADAYAHLAVLGSTDAAVYAAVLRSGALMARPSNRERVSQPFSAAA